MSSPTPTGSAVTEGFYRCSDIVWRWPPALSNPYQRNAVTGMVHSKAIVSPDHPLAKPGDPGVEVFICTAPDGHRTLCFSLKQVQYIQYYIYVMRLADPAHLAWAAEGGHGDEPAFDNTIERVPLPSSVLQASNFVKVERIVLSSENRLQSVDKGLKRDNKALLRHRSMYPDSEPIAATPTEAATSGAALRQPIDPPASVDAEATCTDAEPLSSNVPSEQDTPPSTVPTTPAEDDDAVEIITVQDKDDFDHLQGTLKTAVVNATSDASTPVVSAAAEAVAGPDLDALQDVIQDTLDHAVAKVVAPDPEAYFTHAQQAVALASHGGLAAAYRAKMASSRAADSPAASDDESSNAETDFVPSAVGRSLFVSLSVRTDANGLMDLGFSALWWAQDPNDATQLDTGMESGHWFVQGKERSQWTDYAFGASIPIPGDKIESTFKRKLFDMWNRAGKGPTYFIVHSPDADHIALSALGLDVEKWITVLDTEGEMFPNYASLESPGKRFVIDTARLFAGVDGGADDGRTTRSLAEVLSLLSATEVPTHNANAGNHASRVMQVVFELLNSTLVEHRESLRLVGPGAPPAELAAEEEDDDEEDDYDTPRPSDDEVLSHFEGMRIEYGDGSELETYGDEGETGTL